MTIGSDGEDQPGDVNDSRVATLSAEELARATFNRGPRGHCRSLAADRAGSRHQATPAWERPRRWAELWTELEARAKLDGRGLADLTADTAAQLMSLSAHIVRLDLHERFVGTLAYSGGRVRARSHDFDSADARLLELPR